MSYLLDTNACIALINGSPASVRSHFQKATAGGAQIYIPAVVTFELWYGVAKSARPALNAQRLQTFLSGPVFVLLSTTRTPASQARSDPPSKQLESPSALTTS